jgi:hypothetical protein
MTRAGGRSAAFATISYRPSPAMLAGISVHS